MTSGIYRLTFPSGNTYIGKSINIANRWKQHADKFSKGTAAANMQAEYDKYGLPTGEVLTVCHPDHISITEEYYINRHKPPLNGTYPADPFVGIPEKDIQPIWSFLNLSTIEHVNLIRTLTDLKEAQTSLIDRLKTIRDEEELAYDVNNRIQSLLARMEQQESDIDKLTSDNAELDAKLKQASKPWWQRIFK